MSKAVDPITLQVIKNALYSITDEMSMSLIRAAYSTNIKDRRDCSTAMYTPVGEVIAQTEIGTPIHLGSMPSTVENVLKIYPLESMKEGDHILVNIPYPKGPGHLCDVTCVSPIFYEGKIVALVCSLAHHVDVGGYAPGSMPAGVSEIYQEGLQIPPVKIVKQGVLDDELMRFINQNVRTTVESRGDIMAQVASNNVGEKRLQEVIGRYDPETINFYMHALMDYSEKRMRAGIKKVPNGRYTFEDFIEGTPLTKDMIKIAVAIDIKDDSVVIDFTGTDPQQPDSVNCTIPVVNAAVYYVFRCLIDPDIPPNSGAYRPFEIIAEEGSVICARFPAPVCNATIIATQKVVDVLLGALLDVFSDKTQAASYGVTSLCNIGGMRPGSNSQYSYVETYAGGQGAMHDLDGMDVVQTHMTNTRNAPTEVIESTYPIFVRCCELIPNSEGAGRMRGGVGMRRELTINSEHSVATISTDRRELKPWGAFGGQEASGSNFHIIKKNGEVMIPPSTKYTTNVEDGDTVVVITPGGGGWGDPAEREPEKVQWDVLEEIISIDRAREVYKVVIDPSTLELNKAETEKLRKSK